MMVLGYIASSLIAYFLGSISPGIIISSHLGTDIRNQGSKSSGATNMTRVMGLRYGLLTFLGDFSKAAIAVVIGLQLAGRPGALLAGLFVVIGHNWPAFYQFRGGKGIACSVAVLLILYPVQGIIGSLAAILVIALTRFVSLGSLTVLLVSAALIALKEPFWPFGLWASALLGLGIYQHRANISRLISGKENKLDLKPADKNQ